MVNSILILEGFLLLKSDKFLCLSCQWRYDQTFRYPMEVSKRPI